MENQINLKEIRDLIGRANRQVNSYREKYSKFFENKVLDKSNCHTESMSISNLKSFLSKLNNKNMKIYTYNESDLSESGIKIKNNCLELSDSRNSINLKSFTELISKFKSSDYIRISENKILKSIREDKGNVILNIVDVE